jgi:hypothetical protein
MTHLSDQEGEGRLFVKFQGEEMVGIETGDDDEASLLLEEDGEKRTRESVGANSEVGSGVG